MNHRLSQRRSHNWMETEDRPRVIRVIRKSSPWYGMSDEEIEDCREYIRYYLYRDLEPILVIPLEPQHRDFWFPSFEEFADSAFPRRDGVVDVGLGVGDAHVVLALALHEAALAQGVEDDPLAARLPSPPLVEAVKAYATVGEISDRLRAIFGEHRELADLYAYLAADGSGYVTGDLLVIDGGRLLW